MTGHSLDAIRIKIKRAKSQISDLKSDIAAFGEARPYVVSAKIHDNPPQVVYYLASVEATPLHIPVQAGEVIHSLRAALDHLAYQLLRVSGSTPTKQTAFPVFKSATEYKAQSPGKVKGMRKDIIDAIDAIEPYKGGKGERIWALHELDIIDKHRVLLTLPARYRAFDVGPAIAATIRKTMDFPEFADQASRLRIMIRPKDSLCPLKEGDELLIDKVNLEVNENIKFAFEIAIYEAGIVEGEPLIETVHHFADLVDGVVSHLSVFL